MKHCHRLGGKEGRKRIRTRPTPLAAVRRAAYRAANAHHEQRLTRRAERRTCCRSERAACMRAKRGDEQFSNRRHGAQ